MNQLKRWIIADVFTATKKCSSCNTHTHILNAHYPDMSAEGASIDWKVDKSACVFKMVLVWVCVVLPEFCNFGPPAHCHCCISVLLPLKRERNREHQIIQSASCSVLRCRSQCVKSRHSIGRVHSIGISSMPASVKISIVDIMNHLDDRCLADVKTIIGHMICGYL